MVFSSIPQVLRTVLENSFLVSSHTSKYFLLSLLVIGVYRKKPEDISDFLDTVSNSLSELIIENQRMIVYGLFIAGAVYTFLPGIPLIAYVVAISVYGLSIYSSISKEKVFEEKSLKKGIIYMLVLILVLSSIVTNSIVLNSFVAVYVFAIIFIKI